VQGLPWFVSMGVQGLPWFVSMGVQGLTFDNCELKKGGVNV